MASRRRVTGDFQAKFGVQSPLVRIANTICNTSALQSTTQASFVSWSALIGYRAVLVILHIFKNSSAKFPEGFLQGQAQSIYFHAPHQRNGDAPSGGSHVVHARLREIGDGCHTHRIWQCYLGCVNMSARSYATRSREMSWASDRASSQTGSWQQKQQQQKKKMEQHNIQAADVRRVGFLGVPLSQSGYLIHPTSPRPHDL